MDPDKIRIVSEACDLSGKDLIDFLREERSEKERLDRDERAYQLELRRHEREVMELQLRLQTMKIEANEGESAQNTTAKQPTRSKAKTSKLP